MEYTKEMILNVNYGQEEKTKKNDYNWLHKISLAITKHKIIATVVAITLMLMFLDIMLITSFVNILSTVSF